MYIMGTGSRSMVTAPNAKEIYKHLEQKVFMLRDQDPLLVLISGMAEGWDEAIAKVGMRNSIPYIVHIPNPGYGDYYWKKNSLLGYNRIAEFNELVNHASEVVIVMETLYTANGVHCNFVRNQTMVDACNGALVYKSTSPGTRDAIARLNKAKKPYQVFPFDMQLALF